MSKSHRHGAAEAHGSKSGGAECSKEKIEMLTPKQNGYVEEGVPASEEGGEPRLKHTASIKGMWKKAFKSLKSNDKQTWLSKKGSLKKKDEEPEEEAHDAAKDIDPVYSLLKCAADLPKVEKAQKEGQGSGSTSKASSPSSSGQCPHEPTCFSQSQDHHHHRHGSESSHGGHGSCVRPPPSSPTGTGCGSSVMCNREHMHHIVDESLGSEFRTFYKLTSPVRKLHTHHYDTKKHSNSTLDNY